MLRGEPADENQIALLLLSVFSLILDADSDSIALNLFRTLFQSPLGPFLGPFHEIAYCNLFHLKTFIHMRVAN